MDGVRDWNIQFIRDLDFVDFGLFSYHWTESDVVIWRRTSSGIFSANSYYKFINNSKVIW